MMNQRGSDAAYGLAFILIIVVIVGFFAIGPIYNVWAKERAGEAELAQATFNRKIAIEEAEAQKEAASALAEAEIIRAGGVAEANKIIGDSLRENEAYLRYLWIQGLHDGSGETVYVPTEAGLPILEAGKRVLE